MLDWWFHPLSESLDDIESQASLDQCQDLSKHGNKTTHMRPPHEAASLPKARNTKRRPAAVSQPFARDDKPPKKAIYQF